MNSLTEHDIRASFVNASRREVKEVTLPDVDRVPWDDLDYLGWSDAKRPAVAYVVMSLPEDAAGMPVGVMLRAAPRGPERRKMLCSWCQDIVAKDEVSMFVARRAGAPGRRGDTIGTSICAGFDCSSHARRAPTLVEMSRGAAAEEKEYWIGLRVEELRTRASHFIRLVRDGG